MVKDSRSAAGSQDINWSHLPFRAGFSPLHGQHDFIKSDVGLFGLLCFRKCLF